MGLSSLCTQIVQSREKQVTSELAVEDTQDLELFCSWKFLKSLGLKCYDVQVLNS